MTQSTSRSSSRVRDVLAARPGGRRPHPGFAAAALALLLGVAGLWWGAAAGSSGGSVDPAGSAVAPGSGASAVTGGAATTGDITVRGAYLREPASPATAVAYLTIANTGTRPDTLVSVYCGAARDTTLHDVAVAGTAPTATVDSGHSPSGPLTIGGGASVTLAPGRGHVMLEGLTGPLRAGDRVSMLLTFQRTGQVLVQLPVVGIGTPAPTGPTPSGAGS